MQYFLSKGEKRLLISFEYIYIKRKEKNNLFFSEKRLFLKNVYVYIKMLNKLGKNFRKLNMSHGFGFLVLVLLGGLALAGMFRGLLEGFEAPKDEQNAGSVPVTGSAKLVLGPASLGPASLGPASRGPASRGPASRGPASLVGPPGPKGDKGILNIHLTGSVYPSNEKNRKQKKNDNDNNNDNDNDNDSRRNKVRPHNHDDDDCDDDCDDDY